MPFSESVVTEARMKAHFRCVVCRDKPFVEVHHLVPEAQGGSNTLDNAAPLCAGCHDLYGNNPDKRKQISQMRDQWYDICEKRYASPDVRFYLQETEKIQQALKAMDAKRAMDSQELYSIQNSLSEVMSRAGESIRTTPDFEFVSATSGYVGTASAMAGAVHMDERCPHCQKFLPFVMEGWPCPNCGMPFGPASSSP